MPKHGKRYRAALEKFDLSRPYSLREAVAIVKELATAKFDESIDLVVRLGVDPRKQDQNVRGAVVLPHGTGKTLRVLVFTRGDEAQEAKEAGADYVGFKEYIEKIREGWLDFDAVVATPDAMPEVAKLGRILGPRGLMPSPKTGTVTKNVGQVVQELKRGRVEFRVDRYGNIHVPVGRASFPPEHLEENILTVFRELQSLRPEGFKGTYFKGAHVSPTMGPSVELDVNDVLKRMRDAA